MKDIIIKNVPDGAEDKVLEMASIAIERFLRSTKLVLAKEKIIDFETSVDKFLADNKLPIKFSKEDK